MSDQQNIPVDENFFRLFFCYIAKPNLVRTLIPYKNVGA